MPKKRNPDSPAETPVPDRNTPEIRPDPEPESPILPDEDPGVAPPKLPDNPWPEKLPPTPPSAPSPTA